MNRSEATSTTRARTTERQQAIVDTACTLSLEEGLDNFVMRRIAERCGRKLRNLQYYFATRDDLLHGIAREELNRDVATFNTIAGTGDADEQLTAAIGILVDRWTSAPASVYAPIGLLAMHDNRYQQLWMEIHERFYEALEALIANLDQGANKVELRRRAMLITSLMDGASLQPYPQGKKPTKRQVGNDVQRIATQIAKGD